MSQQIRKLSSPANLVDFVIPADAAAIGLEEEGLTAHIAFRFPANEIGSFLNQPFLRHLGDDADLSLDSSIAHAPPLWTPDRGDLVKGFQGFASDKRALFIFVERIRSKGGDPDHIEVYVLKFPI